jgi:hypothetical protein
VAISRLVLPPTVRACPSGWTFARPRTTGFRQRSASPKSSVTSIVRCRPPAHHQPALPLRPPMTLRLTRPSAPEARAQTLGIAMEFTFTQSRRAG